MTSKYTLSVAIACFERVIDGDGCQTVAEAFGLTGYTLVHDWVIKVARELNNPVWQVDGEPPFIEEPVRRSKSVTNVRRNRRYYLMRLERLKASMSIEEASVAKQAKSVRKLRAPIEWDAKKDALLGTMSDAAVARQINVRADHVRKRRSRLDIPAYAPRVHVSGSNAA